VRVPTPDVSLAIMNLTLKDPTDLEELNAYLKNVSLKGDFVEQIHYSTSTEYVSSNAIGMTSTSVVDAPSNIVSADGKNATVYAWYDNEYGYCCQVVRLAKYITKVRRPRYY
jgi:glyceraldehyde 3-phosphate dehydrogenase